jgi:hypothetical protein
MRRYGVNRMMVNPITTPADWRQLVPHAFSELTEFGVGIDTEAMIDHMAQNGWDPSERITLYQGKILDGRHKHSCAQKAEVEPLFQAFDGTDAEALEFVRKKLLRQHLDPSQRAMVAAKLTDLKLGANQYTAGAAAGIEGPQICGPSIPAAKAAAALNVSARSVETAKLVQAKCIPAIQTAVRKGQLSVSDAASVAKYRPRRQEKAFDAWRLGKVKNLAEWAKKHPRMPKPKPPTAPAVAMTDRLGRAVPDRCRDAFADPALGLLIEELEQIQDLYRTDAWVQKAGKLTPHYPFLLLTDFDQHAHDALEAVQLALESLRAALPYAVCPKCNGDDAPCQTCRNSGVIPEHRYQEVTREPV